MTCNQTDLSQTVCLTLVYNISSRILLSSSLDCGECFEPEVEFNFENKNLVIRVPFIIGGELTFNDSFVSSCVTTNIALKETPKNRFS